MSNANVTLIPVLPQTVGNIMCGKQHYDLEVFNRYAENDGNRQWIADGEKLPLKEVIELTGKLLNKGISRIID